MKKFFLLIIGLFFVANNIFCDNDESSEEGQNNAQTGQTSPSLYTGGMSINIPVYTIQDPDFTLPISLSYTANGYVQSQSSGAVGYNWTLNAGSVITRKIIGSSDQERLDLLRNGAYFTNKEEYFTTNTNSNTGSNSYAPDIFTFSLNGSSGWFYIDFQGEIRVVSNEHFVVDLSEFNFPAISCGGGINYFCHIESGSSSIIKIIDKNGYTYLYGESSKALSFHKERYRPVVDAWHLTKIIAPNGRKMKFTYFIQSPNPTETKNFAEREFVNSTQPTLYDVVSYDAFFTKYLTGIQTSEYQQMSALLQKISIDDNFEMNFIYNPEPPALNIEHHLQSIELKIENETKTATFERQSSASCKDYNVSSSSFIQKHFLTKITTFQNTKYQFSYNLNCTNNTEPMTSPTYIPMCESKDDYGYSKINSQFGLLTNMTNPMGGKTEFYFEPHDYSEMKIYSLEENNQFDISIVPVPRQDLYNNVRIQKIKTLDENNTLISTKEYTYSGGMLHCDFAVKNQDGTYGVFERVYSKFNEPIPVTYSNVTEKISFPSPNVKIYENIYKFHEYNEMPDIVEYYNKGSNVFNAPVFNTLQNIFGFASMSNRRGLIKEKWEKENGVLVRTSAFEYPQIVQNQSDYMVISIWNTKYKMYYAHTNPTEITTTDYINGNEIIKNTKLFYDAKNRLIEKQTDGIDNRKYFTKYSYADDIVPNLQDVFSGFAAGFQQIQRQGWLGRPVEVVSGYYVGETAHYTGGTISLFKKISDRDSFVLPQNPPTSPAHYLSNASPYTPIHRNFAVLSQEKSLMLDAPVTDYQFMYNNGNIFPYLNGSIINDNRYIKVADYEYNNMLRLTKLKPANALETTYVWDEKNLYPVSETTGNFTTTYTYKPFVGKTSETDSRGVKIIYEYDEYWRLKKIKREKNGVVETLEEYQYNYRQ